MENLRDVRAVVFGVRRKDNNVVDIYEGGSVENRSQDGLDESLECRGALAKPKGTTWYSYNPKIVLKPVFQESSGAMRGG